MTDQQAGWIRSLIEPLRVKPGSHVDLPRDFDPGARFGVRKKGDGQDLLRQGVELLAEYQDRLYAQDTYGLLLVLQAMDAAGKDGTIRHVMCGDESSGRPRVQLQAAVGRGTPITTTCGGTAASFPPAARSASSTAPTTRKCSSPGPQGACSTARSSARKPAPVISGNAATGRSTTGSPTWPATASGWSRCSSTYPRRSNGGLSCAGSTSPRRTGNSPPATSSERPVLGRLPAAYADMLNHTSTDARPGRSSRRSQVVHPPGCGRGHRAHAHRHRPALSGPGPMRQDLEQARRELEAEAPPGEPRDPVMPD